MSFSGFPEFNINEPTGFDDNSCSGGNFAFDEFDWELSNVAGPSQHYSRVNVRGDLNYPDFPSPLSAPTSLYPSHGESHDKGKLDRTSQASFGDSLWSQNIVPHFTRAWACPPSHHKSRPLPRPCLPTTTTLPIRLSRPIRTIVSVFPSSTKSQLLTCCDAVPVALTRSYAQPQVISNPDDLTFGFPTTAGSSSQPRVHPSPPREEC